MRRLAMPNRPHCAWPSLRAPIALFILLCSFALPLDGLAQKPSSRILAGQRKAHEFNGALERSQDSRAGRIRETLARLREGGMLDQHERRALAGDSAALGLDQDGLNAALDQALGLNRPARMRLALEHYTERQSTIGWSGVDPDTARLVSLIEGAKLWRSMGRADLARKAETGARRLAGAFGVDIGRALEAPVAYEKERVLGWDGTSAASVGFRRRAGYEAKWAQHTPGLPPGTTRRVVHNPLWWTGSQGAYLDLLYRRLPQLLEARFESDPGARTFRIWHAGHEDGSQTFLLAGIVEEAVRRLRERRPDMARFVDRLKLEIVATDLMQPVQRRRRTLRFGVADGPYAQKAPLLLEEVGLDQVAQASSEVSALEERLQGLSSEAERAAAMRELADAGKIGLVFRQLFSLAAEVAYRSTGDKQLEFSYQLATKRWKIVDREQGGVLNPGARDRTIRFAFSDLTKGRPAGQADLVVCTNVLPYLELYSHRSGGKHEYGRTQSNLSAAFDNLTTALRPGGALLVDERSLRPLSDLARARPELLSSIKAAGKEVLVTRPDVTVPLGELLGPP